MIETWKLRWRSDGRAAMIEAWYDRSWHDLGVRTTPYWAKRWVADFARLRGVWLFPEATVRYVPRSRHRGRLLSRPT